MYLSLIIIAHILSIGNRAAPKNSPEHDIKMG